MKRKILSIVTAFTMAFAFVPMAPAVAMADETSPMQASIEELLVAGDYVEGEAIALVRSDGDLDAAGDDEALAEVDADAVELAAENAKKTEATADDEASLRVQSARSDAYTVQYVVDATRTTQVGFDDKSSMAFNVRSLRKSESFLGGYSKAEHGSVFLAIPVKSTADAKWIGLRNAMSDSNKFHGGIASITCAKKDGGVPVQVDN